MFIMLNFIEEVFCHSQIADVVVAFCFMCPSESLHFILTSSSLFFIGCQLNVELPLHWLQ